MTKIMKEFDSLCMKALSKWGFKLQLIVAIEELSELIHAITRIIRIKDTNDITWDYWDGENVDNLIEEIADVEIMIHQIKLQYNLFEEVRCEKRKKLKNLKEMLKDRETEDSR